MSKGHLFLEQCNLDKREIHTKRKKVTIKFKIIIVILVPFITTQGTF